MPAKAGIQNYLKILDSRLRGNDAKRGFKTFYETINIRRSIFSLFQPGGVSYERRLAASVQSDRKRNSSMTTVELRDSVYFIVL